MTKTPSTRSIIHDMSFRDRFLQPSRRRNIWCARRRDIASTVSTRLLVPCFQGIRQSIDDGRRYRVSNHSSQDEFGISIREGMETQFVAIGKVVAHHSLQFLSPVTEVPASRFAQPLDRQVIDWQSVEKEQPTTFPRRVRHLEASHAFRLEVVHSKAIERNPKCLSDHVAQHALPEKVGSLTKAGSCESIFERRFLSHVISPLRQTIKTDL